MMMVVAVLSGVGGVMAGELSYAACQSTCAAETGFALAMSKGSIAPAINADYAECQTICSADTLAMPDSPYTVAAVTVIVSVCALNAATGTIDFKMLDKLLSFLGKQGYVVFEKASSSFDNAWDKFEKAFCAEDGKDICVAVEKDYQVIEEKSNTAGQTVAEWANETEKSEADQWMEAKYQAAKKSTTDAYDRAIHSQAAHDASKKFEETKEAIGNACEQATNSIFNYFNDGDGLSVA
eukprot:gene398-2_t